MANGTPESEFSIECFQNYSAPEVFIQGLAGIVNQTDVETMIRSQKQMLQRFEKTNEMLTNCNLLSASRLKVAGVEFKKHTQLLLDMKKDLDYIFKKIRLLKTKLSSQYPEAFEIAQKAANLKASQEEEEEEGLENIPKLTTSLTKDISKSTETLRPSISQVFSKSPNDESKTIKESDEKVQEKVQTRRKNRIVNDKTDSDLEEGGPSNSKMAESDGQKEVVRMRKKPAKDEKITSTSRSSSSSDNSNASDSSGESTSDTG